MMEADVLLQRAKEFKKIDEVEISEIRNRVNELKNAIQWEPDDTKRTKLREEEWALILLLRKIGSSRLSKLVNSAMHEIVFGERLIDLDNALPFERQFYESVLDLMRNYWENWRL